MNHKIVQKKRRHKLLPFLLYAAIVLPTGTLSAEDSLHHLAEAHRQITDPVLIREMVQSGKILPLGYFLKQARKSNWTGSLINVELEWEDDVLVYELEIADRHRRIVELVYDAKTGKFLGIEEE